MIQVVVSFELISIFSIITFLLAFLYGNPHAIPFKMFATFTQQLFRFLIKLQCLENSEFNVLPSANMQHF